MTKYYYAGAERVAMRQGGVLYYIFGDHLSSTAVVKNTQGFRTLDHPAGSFESLPNQHRTCGRLNRVVSKKKGHVAFQGLINLI